MFVLMLVLMISRSSLKLGQVWSQKPGHQAKSKDDLVNNLEVTFLKQSSLILPKMFVLMISRPSSKLGHLGSKLGYHTKSKENLVNTLYSGHIFEAIIMNLA